MSNPLVFHLRLGASINIASKAAPAGTIGYTLSVFSTSQLIKQGPSLNANAVSTTRFTSPGLRRLNPFTPKDSANLTKSGLPSKSTCDHHKKVPALTNHS